MRRCAWALVLRRIGGEKWKAGRQKKILRRKRACGRSSHAVPQRKDIESESPQGDGNNAIVLPSATPAEKYRK